MRLRVEPIVTIGQPWIDTLDYHVRPAVERAGENFDSWDLEEAAVTSPEMPPERGAKVETALLDVKIVKVSRIGAA